MRTILALATLAVIGMAGAGYASDRAADNAGGSVITAEQIKTKVDQLGYDVEHMKKDDDAYKARLIDRDSGGTVKARFDGKTGELMHARLARGGHDADERAETGEHRKAWTHKAGAHKERKERHDRHEDRD